MVITSGSPSAGGNAIVPISELVILPIAEVPCIWWRGAFLANCSDCIWGLAAAVYHVNHKG